MVQLNQWRHTREVLPGTLREDRLCGRKDGGQDGLPYLAIHHRCRLHGKKTYQNVAATFRLRYFAIFSQAKACGYQFMSRRVI